MTTRTAQVGDLLLMDGRMRRIIRLNEATGVVDFDHPIPEDDALREKTMTLWKARRDAWCAKVGTVIRSGELKVEGLDPATLTYDMLDAAYRMHEPPPEMSRAGSIGTQWLDWLDGANFWAVRNRIDGKKFTAGNIILQSAASLAAGVAAPAIAATVEG
jgi:hypothetical protein